MRIQNAKTSAIALVFAYHILLYRLIQCRGPLFLYDTLLWEECVERRSVAYTGGKPDLAADGRKR